MIIDGKLLKPIKNRVILVDMEFGMKKSKGGIILGDDDGKSVGIHARWGKVYKIGPEQKELFPNDYVLVEHGRWTRGVKVLIDGEEKKIFMMDYPRGLLLISKQKPLELEMVGK